MRSRDKSRGSGLGKRFNEKDRSHRPEKKAAKPGTFDDNKAQSRLREARQLLAGIGSPTPQPFKPDAFQLEALAALEFEDVLVTAPTGSGKTWIAREEIRRLLEAGRRAWYTTPLRFFATSFLILCVVAATSMRTWSCSTRHIISPMKIAVTFGRRRSF